MKKFPLLPLCFVGLVTVVATGSQASMLVNGDFSEAVINSSPGDNLDPDETTPPAIDNGWYQTGTQFAITDGAALRTKAISSSDHTEKGMGQIVTAEAGLVSGDTIDLSFDQTVVDSDGDSDFGVYVYGFVQTGGSSWLTTGDDELPLRQANNRGDATGSGNYDRYRIYANVFDDGASDFSTSLVLTRDYDYFGIVFQGKAKDDSDSWTVDNVALGTAAPVIAFTSLPTVMAADNDDGTYDYTFTVGAAAGNPAPALSGVLTLDGVDVTQDMVGLVYTVTLEAQVQELVWTVTANNGVAANVVESITEVIPSSLGVAPDQVTGLAVTPGDAQNALSWSAPADNGEAITDYRIEVDSGSGFVTLADGVSAATSFVHTGLSNGVTYTYRVAAVNGLGAIGFDSDTAQGTPVLQTEAPAFSVQPTLAGSNNGDGTYTYTVTTGTATGSPAPTVTGVLTLNSVDVTSAISNGEYVATLQSSAGVLSWTVTASNGIGTDAEVVLNTVVPSSYGLTLTEFSRDMSIFDSDNARGNNRADIPVGGTIASDGAVVEVRPVYADTGAAVSGLDWQDMPASSGGAWSGTYTGVYRTAEWLRLQARIKNDPASVVQMTNRFAAGYVFMVEEQSNVHQGLKPGLDLAAQNAAAAGDPFPVTIGNQPGDFQFVWLGDEGVDPQPLAYVHDGNPHTTSLAAMAETFAKTISGLKVMVGFETRSGSPEDQPLNDDPGTNRQWVNSLYIANTLQADGSEVGAVWALHFQATSGRADEWIAGAFFGSNVDGTRRPELTTDPGGFPTEQIAGLNVNHIWPEAYPGLLTGRTQFVFYSRGNTYAKDIVLSHFDSNDSVRPTLRANFPGHFTEDVGFHGMIVQPVGDVHWDKADVERGYPRNMRYMAIIMMRAGGGLLDYALPTIDHVEYTPQHVTIWSDAGPITTIHRLKGNTTNYPVDPTAATWVEGDLEVIGFTNEYMQNVARTEIVDENGTPATAGRIRIYPAEGELFDDSTRLFYLAGRSGHQQLPGVGREVYTDTYLYDHYPVVDIGVPTVFGQILQPMTDIFDLAKLNDIPSAGTTPFRVEDGVPSFATSQTLSSQSTQQYTMEMEFRRQLARSFYFTNLSNDIYMEMFFNASGGISVSFKHVFSQDTFVGSVPSEDVPNTVDGFHTFRIAIDLSIPRVDLFVDEVPVDNQTTPQFGANTVLAGGTPQFRGNLAVEAFNNGSGGDVRRFRAWADYAAGGVTPAGTPWLEVTADPAGAFFAPAGGRYNVLENGVSETNPQQQLQEWRMQYFGTADNIEDAANDANPAGDGIPNLIKYAAGLRPDTDYRGSTQAPHLGMQQGQELSYTFTLDTNKSDISLQVEASEDLSPDSWRVVDLQDAGNLISVQENTPEPGVQTITIRVLGDDDTRRFLRLKTTTP